MKKTLSIHDPFHVWFAELSPHLTQITFKRGEQGDLTTSITWLPSAEHTIPKDIQWAFEALLANMLFPSIGRKDSLVDELKRVNERLAEAQTLLREARDAMDFH